MRVSGASAGAGRPLSIAASASRGHTPGVHRVTIATIGMVVALGFGCATTTTRKLGQDMIGISCKRSKSLCFEAANKACPDGYDVIGNEGQSGALPTSVGYIPYYKGELVVRCTDLRTSGRTNTVAADPDAR